MKKEQVFMMLFRFTPDFENSPTEEEQAEMHQKWGEFIGNIAIQEKLVSTYQLGFNGKQITSDLSIIDGFPTFENQTIGGNMVIKANSLEEATEIAKDCPILQMGGTVEVRNIIPMEN